MAVALRLAMGVVAAAVCAAAVWALAAPPAGARPVRLKLVAGTLRVSAPSVAVTAAGAKSVTVTVTDARGVGTGWSLKLVTARPVTVARIAARCAKHSTCTLPQARVIGPSPLVLHALRGSGMGVVKLIVTFARLKSGPPGAVKFAVSR